VTDVMAHEETLARTDFFADADPNVLASIAASGAEHHLIRGDVLFQEGDPPDAIYLVLRGRLAIAIANPIDRRESVVALMEIGDLFGEMGMLDGGPRSAMARALEPTAVLSIPYDSVMKMFDENPKLLWNVTRLLAQRIRTTDEALADSVFLDVTGRTAKRLLELADGSDEFTLPVTQEELAGMVGASRERVNKAIASFIRLGWLEQHDRSLMGRVAGIRIVGEQAHQLHAEACFDPAVARHQCARHHAHHVRCADIHHRSERQVGGAFGDCDHRVGDDLDGVGHRQQRENISIGQNNHRVRSSSWPQPSPVTGRPSCSSSSDR